MAGATSQYILLPGNDYTSAQTFVSDGSAAALINITNLDGSIANLIFDVHQYLDSDGSGTHTDCVSDHVADTFTPLATYLRQNQGIAVLTETGGGSDAPTCLTGVEFRSLVSKYPAYNKSITLHSRRLLRTILPGSEFGCVSGIPRLGRRFLLCNNLHTLPHTLRLRCRRLG